MTLRHYFLLLILGISLVTLIASFQHSPGYMDAEYYYAGGLRLAEGHGFTEQILWNYLDDPSGLPHPSHAYWMPMASIIAYLGMAVARTPQFFAARIGFIIIAGCVAPVTAALAYRLTMNRTHAMLAGILAAIPGFYLSYLATTDTFGLSMLMGAVWLIAVGEMERRRLEKLPSLFIFPIILGLITGIFHLSRADGLTWLLVGLLAFIIQGLNERRSTPQQSHLKGNHLRDLVTRFAALFLGYLLIMGPWIMRNLNAFGTPLSPGGVRALWLTDYDELFIYPPDVLTLSRWLESGWQAILRSRWFALGQNLQNAFAVQGEIFLVPLILLGLYHLRKDLRVRLGVLAWLFTLVVMTVVFPHAGWRGGFFHSGAAYQPLFWAVVPSGLEVFIDFGKRVRGWILHQARPVFSIGLIVLSLMLSTLAVQKRVLGASLCDPIWNHGLESYTRLEGALQDIGASPDAIVLVNNAPGYFIASQRPAISVPDGLMDVSLEVARRFGASYLLLEGNHPAGLDELFRSPGDRPGLQYLSSFEGAHIFEIVK
jgi:hypothetical protein